MFDLRLVVTGLVPFLNSSNEEDNIKETEQKDVKYGCCDNQNEESQGYRSQQKLNPTTRKPVTVGA